MMLELYLFSLLIAFISAYIGNTDHFLKLGNSEEPKEKHINPLYSQR